MIKNSEDCSSLRERIRKLEMICSSQTLQIQELKRNQASLKTQLNHQIRQLRDVLASKK